MIGIVTGIRTEARCCKDRLVQCNGPGVRRAADACDILLTRGITGIVSFGIAGSLMQELPPGSLVLANEVVLTNGCRLPTDERWRKNLHQQLIVLSPVEVPVVSSQIAIDTPTTKQILAAVSGSGIVDMESGGAALRAASASIPFLSVRVVVDPVDRYIPPIATTSLTADGRLDLWTVLPFLAFQKLGQSLSLAKLARDSYTAFSVLKRVIQLTGIDFGFHSLSYVPENHVPEIF